MRPLDIPVDWQVYVERVTEIKEVSDEKPGSSSWAGGDDDDWSWVGLGGSATPDDQPTTGVHAEQLGMLESDQLMLQQMRSGTSPGMTTMIREDPMWVDPDMIKAQEEYQAQLDRMLGK